MRDRLTRLITPWRAIGATVLVTGLVIATIRFARGLGSVTNLSDETPWGIWVGFDILAGIGLAAGGFMVAAAVHVFGFRRYRPLLRPAILTALIGYLLFIVGLILEIGRPWNMWRCITNHNFHSPLFEIAWCVMLYTTVLLLEFSTVVVEKLGWHRFEGVLHKVLAPLVIVGVLLSTLHQSTLGTLFTIVPHKLHALWYSPILPIHFFISCLAAGLAMICFESFLSWRFLGHPPPMNLLPNIAKVMALILVVYFVLRIEDLALRKALSAAFVPGMAAFLFWLENLFFVAIPVVIVFRSAGRMTTRALFLASFSTVLGFVMHRFNVAVSGMQLIHPTGYFPTWQEVVVSMSLIVMGFIAAGLAAWWLPIHEHGGGRSEGPDTTDTVAWRPPVRRHSAGVGGPVVAVLLMVAAVASATVYDVPETVELGTLANRYEPVVLSHAAHAEIAGSCTTCHHQPFGSPAECTTCHTEPVEKSAFVHEQHWEVEDCTGCHHKQATGDLRCGGCHQTPYDPGRPAVIGLKGAYHQLCLTCHGRDELNTDCVTCHAPRSVE